VAKSDNAVIPIVALAGLAVTAAFRAVASDGAIAGRALTLGSLGLLRARTAVAFGPSLRTVPGRTDFIVGRCGRGRSGSDHIASGLRRLRTRLAATATAARAGRPLRAFRAFCARRRLRRGDHLGGRVERFGGGVLAVNRHRTRAAITISAAA
jgi:hypothetical protein